MIDASPTAAQQQIRIPKLTGRVTGAIVVKALAEAIRQRMVANFMLIR
jgi:hypothetical protein